MVCLGDFDYFFFVKITMLYGEEQANANDCAGSKRCLAVVGDNFHSVVYPTGQLSDKVFGGHGEYICWLSVFSQLLTTLAQRTCRWHRHPQP